MAVCELCELKRLTKWHHEKGLFVICDCLTCGIPMLVFRSHGPRTKEERVEAMIKIIELYGKRLIKIRMKPRKVIEHEYGHIYLEKE